MDVTNIDIAKFVERAEAMYSRLTFLYNNQIDPNVYRKDVLPQAFLELGNASEILKVAIEELYSQNEHLIKAQNAIEIERQRYQNLFEEAPDGYLVTDTKGIIQEVNHTAVKLLSTSQQYMIGKPIVNHVSLDDRQSFRSFVTQLSQGDKVKEFMLRWQKRNGALFDGACTVTAICDRQGKPVAFLWLLRDLTERKLIETTYDKDTYELSQGRPLHQYCKGENIPLNPSGIWHVNEGVVKLNTLCETGEEVLVGLAKEGMVFGSSLTMLQTYQATALSDVKLVPIYLTEIAALPTLNHTLLTKVTHRLRQTEAFIAIAGRRRVKDRFYNLLQLLKQEIGQPVAQGIRLKIRLTHEELASACCTTRVTITRLIGKLQKEGIISFDGNNHMIIKGL